MQYPLTALLQFTRSRLLVNVVAFTSSDGTMVNLQQEYTRLAQETRFSVCSYLGTARTEQQAVFMIHALKVALLNLQNDLEQHKTCYINTKEEAALFDAAINEIDKLREFISENFAGFPVFPLPSFCSNREEIDERLQTNLSVPQLGLLLRLFVETGILDERSNVSSLMKKFASVFRTKKKMEISSESLRIKYYTPEKAAVNIIREYLLRMMRSLSQY